MVTASWSLVRHGQVRAKAALARTPALEWWFIKQNSQIARQFPIDFEVLDFRLLSADDPFDLKWIWWSRIYEYEYVLNAIDKYSRSSAPSIHNTSWGFQGVHIDFKEELERRYGFVLSSDVRPSQLDNTAEYNLLCPPPVAWAGRFEFVLNVSTIEEIHGPQLQVLQNLMLMLKPGGHLVATFDHPGVQLHSFERLLRREIGRPEQVLSGKTSRAPSLDSEFLHVVALILRRSVGRVA